MEGGPALQACKRMRATLAPTDGEASLQSARTELLNKLREFQRFVHGQRVGVLPGERCNQPAPLRVFRLRPGAPIGGGTQGNVFAADFWLRGLGGASFVSAVKVTEVGAIAMEHDPPRFFAEAAVAAALCGSQWIVPVQGVDVRPLMVSARRGTFTWDAQGREAFHPAEEQHDMPWSVVAGGCEWPTAEGAVAGVELWQVTAVTMWGIFLLLQPFVCALSHSWGPSCSPCALCARGLRGWHCHAVRWSHRRRQQGDVQACEAAARKAR